MLTRIITAAVALAVFVPILYFASTPALPIALAVLCVIAVYEMYSCVGMKKCYPLLVVSAIAGASLPLLARFKPEYMASVAVFVIVFALFEAVFGFRKYTIDAIGFVTFETLVTSLGFSLMVLVRDRQPIQYLLIFIAAWGTDTFAYFVGKFFGKRKLCPEISPKKTVAGGIGGVVGCMVGFEVFALVCNNFFDCDFSYIVLPLVAIPLSVCGQVGDLAASLVKRRYGIKDYGKLFPGHGGVLDRFDSILPISIFAFILTELNIL